MSDLSSDSDVESSVSASEVSSYSSSEIEEFEEGTVSLSMRQHGTQRVDGDWTSGKQANSTACLCI